MLVVWLWYAVQEEARARDLFYGLWIPDLFMRRVQANEQWSLFCPNEAPGLADCWGEEFEALYEKYEREVRSGACTDVSLTFLTPHVQV